MAGAARPALLLFLGAFGLFGLFAHGNLENPDSAVTMHAARGLLLRGDSGLRRDGADSTAEQAIAEHIATTGTYGMRGRNGLYYVWFPMGHQFLILPAVAIGEVLAALLPRVEEQYRQQLNPPELYPHGMFVWDHAMVALLPALFGAGSVLVLYLLGAAMRLSSRDSLVLTAAVALCTQFFPTTRETLSDGPGMFFLLASLLGVVRYHRGALGARGLLLSGLLSGFAVLTRYPHAMLVAVLTGSVALVAFRRRRLLDVVWFGLGGLPCLILLCTVNYLRFGEIGETGYGNASLAQWFNYPIYLGLPKVLIAAGKGILWFSPLLWLALPLAFRRGVRRTHTTALAWLFFLLPVLMFSSTLGWQSGQVWGIRYVTPGVVVFVFLVLAQSRPWQARWTWRWFAVLCGIGLLVSITSLVAPTRGHNQLAAQGVLAYYDNALQRGEITAEDFARLDAADHFFFLPRFSPLHSHWSYAWLSLTGRFEDARGYTRDGAENTTEPMFGVRSTKPDYGRVPQHWADRDFRHLWWVFWSSLLGAPVWLLVIPWALATAWLLRSAVRGLTGVKSPVPSGR